jgi:hypothetical protein
MVASQTLQVYQEHLEELFDGQRCNVLNDLVVKHDEFEKQPSVFATSFSKTKEGFRLQTPTQTKIHVTSYPFRRTTSRRQRHYS